MDLIMQKATELGVSRILPVFAERSVVKVDASKGARKLEHWRSVAIAACEQCGRNRVPEVAEPIALGDAVRALEPGTARYLLAAGAKLTLTAAMRQDAGKPSVLMIGPEGGLADTERDFAGAHGFTACSMGPRILRTETAGLAALAIMQTVAGDFA
jgi:16S rRNA (uracil1498-N3)-methyltransferase